MEVVQEFISLIDVDDPEGGENSLIYNQTIADPANMFVDTLSDFRNGDFRIVNDIVTQTNSHDELCDIWVAKCPLVSINY